MDAELIEQWGVRDRTREYKQIEGETKGKLMKGVYLVKAAPVDGGRGV